MTPERWAQIKHAYSALIERPPEARVRHLDALRGQDPELCAELEQLLNQTTETWTIGPDPFHNLQLLGRPSLPPILKGRYLLQRQIGCGGFGVVFLAADQQLHAKPVVVKIMLQAGSDRWKLKKFRIEIEALARLNHPGVVSVSDSGETDDGIPFFVMEYVQGESLRSLIPPHGMDLAAVAGIVRQVASALDAAHRKGILHRDLKPDNIIIQTLDDGDRRAKLLDFGIATIARPTESGDTTRIAGTLPYMAPEQLRGKPSAASDIYALGLIAYEMVTGRTPFRAENMWQLHELQMAGVQVRLGTLRPELPEAAEHSILKALQPVESQRHASILSFAQEFVLALQPVIAATQTPNAPAVRPSAERVLDVAAARQMPIHKPAEVVAQIRGKESGGLAAILAIDLDYSLRAEDVRSKAFALEFPRDSLGFPQPIDLALRLECPDFEPQRATKNIQIPIDRDSDVCTFLITPHYLGDVKINVELIREDVIIASRPLTAKSVPSDREVLDRSRMLAEIPLIVTVRPPEGGERCRDATTVERCPPIAALARSLPEVAPHLTRYGCTRCQAIVNFFQSSPGSASSDWEHSAAATIPLPKLIEQGATVATLDNSEMRLCLRRVPDGFLLRVDSWIHGSAGSEVEVYLLGGRNDVLRIALADSGGGVASGESKFDSAENQVTVLVRRLQPGHLHKLSSRLSALVQRWKSDAAPAADMEPVCALSDDEMRHYGPEVVGVIRIVSDSTLTVELAASAEVQPGDALHVLRDSLFIGVAILMEVGSNLALCEFQTAGEGVPRAGDLVRYSSGQ